MKENQVNHMSEIRLPLFAEWKKLDPLPRYSTRADAKMAFLHTFVNFPTQFPENGPRLQ